LHLHLCRPNKIKLCPILGKGQNVENQNVESQKEHQKFEKDQNVKSQIRLSTFWSFLTPEVKSERLKSNLKGKLLPFWFYLWRQERSERQKSNLSDFQILMKSQLPMA
jgi:hypothetical protein